MKYICVFILCFFTFGCSTNNAVSKITASSSTKTSADGTVVNIPLSITELVLDNCNITLSNALDNAIRLEFGDRVFDADSLSLSKNANGSCRVEMTNGQLVE